KKLYVVDIESARDVSNITGFTGPASAPIANIKPYALLKNQFLDIVAALTMDPADMLVTDIPAKLEGITFGPDITVTDPITHASLLKHTLFVGNDNDFLATLAPPVGNGDNPNQFFVFSFTDADLPFFEPQRFRDGDHDQDDDND